MTIIINALLVVVDPDLLLTSLPLCARDRQQRGAKWFLNRKERKKRHVNLQVPPVDLIDDL